ncbi:hypothetical protein KS4_30940 [Poriferisphaera corsica]|uniref:Transmembrane protein n=1 Tax=Poriferisphaera corsica TaxID=2528020 RepID=A0A517YXT2_9BACT|nr:hypothetical protein [Poriferisphaera corsica]QDU35017.1 hypothetical protein KS4_30940 [Poriferisphaera corsica]
MSKEQRERRLFKRARDRRIAQHCLLAVVCFGGGWWLWEMSWEVKYVAMVLGLVGVGFGVAAFWKWVSDVGEDEALRRWVDGPGVCGKCGYDVRACEDGRCSECGWVWPKGEVRLMREDVWDWRMGWRIDYLECEGKWLRVMLGVWLLLTVVMGVCGGLLLGRPFDLVGFATLFVLLATVTPWMNTGLNVVRIWQYMRRSEAGERELGGSCREREM